MGEVSIWEPSAINFLLQRFFDFVDVFPFEIIISDGNQTGVVDNKTTLIKLNQVR